MSDLFRRNSDKFIDEHTVWTRVLCSMYYILVVTCKFLPKMQRDVRFKPNSPLILLKDFGIVQLNSFSKIKYFL